MNLDEAIEFSNEVEKAYDNGFISLYSPPGKEIHLNGEKFHELVKGKVLCVNSFDSEYDRLYFKYNSYEFFTLIKKGLL